MPKLLLPVLLMLLLPALAGAFPLQGEANQTVTFEVSPISELTVSGDPGVLHITAAVAGEEPTDVDDASTTYSLTCNEVDRKITARLDEAMPTGMELLLEMAAPEGATSLSFMSLTALDQNIVTGITCVAENGKTITYRCCADADAGVVAPDSRTVTLTLTGVE